MAKYAYRDKDRKNIIYSDKAIEEDRDTAFFCPNHVCNAKLYICAVDGSKSAYFRATKPNFKHVKNCRLVIVVQSLIRTTMMNPNLFMKMQ